MDQHGSGLSHFHTSRKPLNRYVIQRVQRSTEAFRSSYDAQLGREFGGDLCWSEVFSGQAVAQLTQLFLEAWSWKEQLGGFTYEIPLALEAPQSKTRDRV